ncbi:uncharacterized protein LOC111647827 isoform X3 [Seriola lalandi dorsalis]|uniref:uncharacterized protein LOC111647827 isoform X3 n=1 Tax=Seriola lalandi dorsalis TaxID=1841481 RepID=UPI000C6FABDA|nr:uncharacterized protein LOC111647827 isoform X3 [Seriola lalandi dorsalis]
MVELKWTKWIKMSLFVMLGLQFTAAVTGQDSFLFFRDGDEAALPCKNARDDQDKCGSTYWTFSHSLDSSVDLVVQGQFGKDAQTKSDRLSLTENCSLVLKKVSDEDVGLYGCRQRDKSGRQQAPDAVVRLSVVTMTEHEDSEMAVMFCYVFTFGRCGYPVQWLYEGIKDDAINIVSTPGTCSARVSFNTFHLHHKPKYQESFKCEVTDINRKKRLLFTFIPQSSGEKTAAADCSALTFIMLLMRVAELLLITVITVLLVRARGNQRAPECNTVSDSVRSRTVTRSGAAASQVHGDEDEGRVSYENFGEPSSSVRIR